MKRSALYPLHQALGARFTTVAGWEMPQHFGDPHAEYQALRHGVGLCDLSHRGLIRVVGQDRQRFLHAMVSNDTKSLQPGQGCYATFLTAKGHLIADFVVYTEDDAYLLEVEPHVASALVEALEFFVISEDVTLHDESGDRGLLALQGPRAAALLTLALGQEMPALPMYASTTCRLAGHTVHCQRRSHTGELGYQLLAPPEALPEVWQALWAHREACAARPVGLEMLDVARIEAGIPVYGRDMTAETIPIEANLEAAISYAKGCYIGQEVIARLDARGHVNRKLVGLLLKGEVLPAPGAKIVSPQREVGWVTSATFSPARQQNIALGYVRREVLTPGTDLEVYTDGLTLGATVVELPFYSA